MKKLVYTFLLAGLFVACQSGNTKKKAETSSQETVEQIDPATLLDEESKLLLDYLDELGDYVNSRSFPSLIKAESVHEGLSGNQLVLDIRSKEQYAKGHIKGARNLTFSALPEYFASEIVAFEYDKIILISDGGQEASYATCLLRLMGYGNVYAMRWGMSGWHADFAQEGWMKAVGSTYTDKLSTDVFDKAVQQKLPVLNTGKSTGEEILLERVNQLFAAGTHEAHLRADDVFANTAGYYIMNYIRKDKYEAGHIPGAIRYKPQATLGIVSAMSTIAQNKPSVVYCGTGHNSGFVTAYLRLFGYDARTLIYGNNAFMHDKMVEERATLSWLPFTTEEVKDYTYVK